MRWDWTEVEGPCGVGCKAAYRCCFISYSLGTVIQPPSKHFLAHQVFRYLEEEPCIDRPVPVQHRRQPVGHYKRIWIEQIFWCILCNFRMSLSTIVTEALTPFHRTFHIKMYKSVAKSKLIFRYNVFPEIVCYEMKNKLFQQIKCLTH